MKKLTVKDITLICNGNLFCGSDKVICKSFNKDTRTIKSEDIYIGIKGANFDGNSLYQEAFSKGASACILEKKSFKEDKNYSYDKPIILVNNSKEAIAKIASYIRNNSKAKFIGITGSVGKTSTKDMVYSVVSKEYKTLKTLGNFNNDIGLPLTIMRLQDEECAVIEMGMNNLGEIDYLTKITKPHIAIITNVGTAHIGNLGSRENILKAKLEIKNGLTSDGTLIINNDNDLLHKYYLKNKDNVLTIGINNESDIMAQNIIINNECTFDIIYQGKRYPAKCKVPSIVYIYNGLIAFATGMLLNIPIKKILNGIESFTLTENRLDFITNSKNINIINDSYNASVDSMKSSIDILVNRSSGRKIAALGSMLELGSYSKVLHEEVGDYLTNKVDILITVGIDAKYIYKKARVKEKYAFDNNNDAINKLNKILKANDTVLIKASNGLKFIEIVNALI